MSRNSAIVIVLVVLIVANTINYLVRETNQSIFGSKTPNQEQTTLQSSFDNVTIAGHFNVKVGDSLFFKGNYNVMQKGDTIILVRIK